MENLRTVGIADAQLLDRSGIKHLLGKIAGIELIFEATNQEELLTELSRRIPDILVIDYDQAPHFNSATVEKVIARFPQIQLLIITDNEEKDVILRLLRSGVPTFITKACNEQEVEDALRAAVQREKFFCAKVLDYLLDGSKAGEERSGIAALSPREIEIVSLVGRGLVAKEIATKLHLSTHTVYTHRKNILKKLGLSSSSELLVFALQNNLTND